MDLSYELYKVKDHFFIEMHAEYIHPKAKEFINVSRDSVTDMDCLLVKVSGEFLDIPLTVKVTNPKVAYTHIGMVVDCANMCIHENIQELQNY